jgi:hypothetical protein
MPESSAMSHALRRFAAITLLSVMCLGSTSHFLHHLFDRDCDVDGRHGAVPCTVCAGLHGGAITPQAEISAPRAPSVVARTTVAGSAEPDSRDHLTGTPRAPPAA